MKKRVISLSLAALLIVALCIPVFAADDDAPVITTLYSDASVTFKDGSTEQLVVSVNNLTAGGYYVVLMLKASVNENGTLNGSPEISSDTILYIDQVTADSNGTATFDNVYPSTMTGSVIRISGTGLTAPIDVATIRPQYTLGDVNGDGKINTRDAMLVAQYSIGISNTGDFVEAAADVNGDGKINTRDAMLIAQYSIGILTEFPTN